ncbi:hypothetical protein D9758_014344 [Tetrapyrgos nigripes]|uniref:Uncharacterized protein n=1 Tax=Tetrapyrgos nigripes TaxID=182062 RepID=A0A8H5FGE2_9AGAR|nr:hypothetical protein D9758_014344 [Tetrapyrgos nigripes]
MSYNSSDNFNNSSSMSGGFGGDSYREGREDNFQSQTSSYGNGMLESLTLSLHTSYLLHPPADNYSTGSTGGDYRNDNNYSNTNSSSGMNNMNDNYSSDNREKMGMSDFNNSSSDSSSFSSGGMTGGSGSGFSGSGSNNDNYRGSSSENDSFGSSGRRSEFDEDSTRSSSGFTSSSGMGSGFGSNSGESMVEKALRIGLKANGLEDAAGRMTRNPEMVERGMEAIEKKMF